MFRVICLFVLTLSPALALCNTYPLMVLQKGTGDPVADATVVVKNSENYATSDQNGNLSLSEIVLPIDIRILADGYETLEKKLTSKNVATGRPIKVYLEPLSFQTETLEVTEDRIQEKTSRVVLQTEELRRAPGTQGDPLKAIQSLPGVVTAVEGAGVMYIRGSEPNQSLVWVDQARIGYLYHFGGLHSTISPQLVKDFNMFLGGFPVEYGDALGGALDVRLRKPRNDRLHQNYSLGTYESSAVIEGPIGGKGSRDSGYLSARRSYIDLLFSPEMLNKLSDSPDSITQVPRFHDVNAVWHRQLSQGDMRLQYFRAADEIRLTLNSPEKTDPDAVGELSSQAGYDSLSLVWNQRWMPDLHTSSSLYVIDLMQKLKIGQDPITFEPYYLEIEERDYIWQPEVRYNLTPAHKLTAGSEFIYAVTPVNAFIARPPGFNEADYSFTELEKFRIDKTFYSYVGSAYAKWQAQLLPGYTVQLGGRATWLKSNGRVDERMFSPRANMEYQLTDNTLLLASWGRYSQFPDGPHWAEGAGNPGLHEYRSEHRIVGIRHKITALWDTQIEAYHKPMWDLLSVNDQSQPPNNYGNDTSGDARGFDILLKRQHQQGKMGWLSYSWLRSERTEDGVSIPFDGDQRHSFTAVWSQPLPGRMKKWSAGVRARVNSGKPYTPVTGRTGLCQPAADYIPCADQANAEADPDFKFWQAQYAQKNSARLPVFYQLDLRLDRDFLFNTWKMAMYVDILNLLNTQNITGYDYGDRLERIDNPKAVTAFGILPSIGLEITL